MAARISRSRLLGLVSCVGQDGDGVGVVDRTGRDQPCNASGGAVEGGAAFALGCVAYGVQVGVRSLSGWEMPPPRQRGRQAGCAGSGRASGAGRRRAVRAGASPRRSAVCAPLVGAVGAVVDRGRQDEVAAVCLDVDAGPVRHRPRRHVVAGVAVVQVQAAGPGVDVQGARHELVRPSGRHRLWSPPCAGSTSTSRAGRTRRRCGRRAVRPGRRRRSRRRGRGRWWRRRSRGRSGDRRSPGRARRAGRRRSWLRAAWSVRARTRASHVRRRPGRRSADLSRERVLLE